MVTATLRNYRQSPRKVRVVANLIKGKHANTAIDILTFTRKDAALPILKLLKSAVANAKQQSLDEATLAVATVTVNKGPIMKRMMPRARGRGFPIHKHTSTVTVVLENKAVKAKKSQSTVHSPKKKTSAENSELSTKN